MDARTQTSPDSAPTALGAAAFALLCVGAPILVFAALDQAAPFFLPTPQELVCVTFAEDPPQASARLLHDMPARMQTVLSIYALCLAALAGLLYALCVAKGALRWAILAFSAVVGVYIYQTDIEVERAREGVAGIAVAEDLDRYDDARRLMRMIAVDMPLEHIVRTADDVSCEHNDANAADAKRRVSAERWRPMRLLAAGGAAFAVAGVAALVLTFASLALRAGGDRAAFRKRKRRLQTTLALSALVLTLSVASTYALYRWPLAMLGPGDAKSYVDMISMASGFWGLAYTLILIAAAVPAMISFGRDVNRAAAADGRQGDDINKWIADGELRFAPREGVAAFIAAAAPILTTPLLDALSSVLV